ncbi:hypothetical protein, partial [Nocardioides sp.]|uniref:hypothetical protein n=1 Tax=Nocardioides sp. TaxID=35761 RepID=UPI00273310F5
SRPDTAPAAALLLGEMVRERAATLQAWVEDLDTPAAWVQASLEQSTSVVLSHSELSALNREVQEVIARHTAQKEGRRSVVGTPAPDGGDYRRVRIYYDGIPLPAAARGGDPASGR